MDKIELHGRLSDDQPCKLLLEPERAILEIAADTGQWAALSQAFADPMVVVLSDGRIATLKGNYAAPGTRAVTGPGGTFALTRVEASQAFIGPRAFDNTDLVDAISCRPTNELLAQYYTAHRRHVRVPRIVALDVSSIFSHPSGNGEIIIDAVDSDQLTICDFEQDNLRVSLRIGISEASNAQGTTLNERRLTRISYKQSVPLDVALSDLMTVMNFYSFVIGEVVSPMEV